MQETDVLETIAPSSALGSQEPAGHSQQMMSVPLAGAMLGGRQRDSAILSRQAEPTAPQVCEMPIEVLQRPEAEGVLGTERGGAWDEKDDFSSEAATLTQQFDELEVKLEAIIPPATATAANVQRLLDECRGQSQQLEANVLLAASLSSTVQVIPYRFYKCTLRIVHFATARYFEASRS